MVTPERVHTTTDNDLLANHWQTAVLLPPRMRQAGSWTRPELLVWGGAPRRNRTGDPILTMEPPGTAMRTAVSPAHARPSGPKLTVLFRRRYAFASKPCLDRRGSQPSFAPDITSQAPLPHSTPGIHDYRQPRLCLAELSVDVAPRRGAR